MTDNINLSNKWLLFGLLPTGAPFRIFFETENEANRVLDEIKESLSEIAGIDPAVFPRSVSFSSLNGNFVINVGGFLSLSIISAEEEIALHASIREYDKALAGQLAVGFNTKDEK